MPSPPAGPIAPPRDWDALKQAYEVHDGDLAPLAAANKITVKTLKHYATARKWVSASNTPLAVPMRKAAAKSKAAAKRRNRPLKRALKRAAAAASAGVLIDAASWPPRQELVRRIRRVIMRKLEQLERDMETEEPLSPADHERQARLVGTTISNVEKLDGLARAGDSAGAAASSAGPKSAGAIAADADRIRREIAAKLESLRERLAR